MRDRFQRFMSGRYGADQLSKFLLGVCVVCIVLNMFTRTSVFYWLALILLVYSYFRIFSRNHAKRYKENQQYLGLKNKIVSRFQRERSYAKERKTHHIYTCPNCKQKIRVPKGKGKICVTCPKCKTEFVKKS